MKYGVYYYTRTNNSKRIAEKISQKLSCDLMQITDNINWRGFLGYMKAGFYSMTNKHVEIQFEGDPNAMDGLIVVGPLWAGGLAPALRMFISEVPRNKIHLVVSSIESQVKDRSGFASVDDISSKSGNEDEVVNKLVNRLSMPDH